MKILCLGLESAGKSSIINRLKFNETKETQPTQGFNVTTVEFNSGKYTIWEVGGNSKQKGAWKQYTQNSAGLIYVVDSTTNLTQARSELQEILADPNIQGVPLVVFANKVDKGGNVTDVMEELQLNGIQDREWHCQGSEAVSGIGVQNGFEWISKQVSQKGNKSFSFDAEPRVVKQHSKYKQNQQENTKSQNTFQNLMKDQRIIQMNPIQQESEYVRLEKERIKIENMHQQLINFKKNKKKMTPYDIKPSPNPRIDVNLDFFLTDHNNLIQPQQNTTDVQTDDFLQKPPSPKYIPKKTGIDAVTQVEDYELFDFNREVTPIVEVIVTKVLEQSMLEIEQEEEIKKMRKFKEEYYERRERDKDKWKRTLNKEIRNIQKKNEKLQKFVELEDRKMQTQNRLQSYNIAGQYLKGIKENCFEQLYNNGYYPNKLDIYLKNNYLDWLIQQTGKQLQKLEIVEKQTDGLFDKVCIPVLTHIKDPIFKQVEKKKIRKQQRRFNLQEDRRMVRIYYNESKLSNSNFAKDYDKWTQKTLDQFKQALQTRQNELQDKVDTGEISKDDYDRILQEEFPEVSVPGFVINRIKKVAFTLAHNQFYETLKDQRFFELFALAITKDGEIAYEVNPRNPRGGKNGKSIRYKQNIRDKQKKVTDDESIIIDLNKISDDIGGIVLFVRLPDLQKTYNDSLAKPFVNEGIQHARFGIEDWKHSLGIDNVNLTETYKLEEYLKQDVENNEAYSFVITSYSIVKRANGWQLEYIKQAQKGLFQNEENDFKTQIAKFYSQSEGPRHNELNQEDLKQSGVGSDAGSSGVTFLHPKFTDEIEINLNQNFEDIEKQLIHKMEEQDPELSAYCTNGFEFFFRDKKPLTKISQIKRSLNITDIVVKRKPEVIIEEKADEQVDGDNVNPEDQEDYN